MRKFRLKDGVYLEHAGHDKYLIKSQGYYYGIAEFPFSALEKVEDTQYPNPPHKHRDLIVAWANGATIEFYSESQMRWNSISTPDWDGAYLYRIKPTKSAKDIEIESIQAEMTKLQERMEKLKEE